MRGIAGMLEGLANTAPSGYRLDAVLARHRSAFLIAAGAVELTGIRPRANPLSGDSFRAAYSGTGVALYRP